MSTVWGEQLRQTRYMGRSFSPLTLRTCFAIINRKYVFMYDNGLKIHAAVREPVLVTSDNRSVIAALHVRLSGYSQLTDTSVICISCVRRRVFNGAGDRRRTRPFPEKDERKKDRPWPAAGRDGLRPCGHKLCT
jgi:hypothetical protein